MRRVRLFMFRSLPFVSATWAQYPVTGGAGDAFLRLARCNALFALSEISKAVVIVGVGDFVTADVVGELFASALPATTPVVLLLPAISMTR